jgi:MFS transporter, OFA family, oxalate/formate antiporter
VVDQTSALTAGAAGVAAKNRGWIVTFAGTGVNLMLGILYTWSVISQAIPKDWGWSEAEKSLPYSIALLAFAFAMIPAGLMQDKIGPRWVAAVGGVLVGVGCVLSSFFKVPMGFVVGFGILAGAGIGFGYASATPPAIKWFGRAKTGMISGIVVAGFGLASVWASPSAQFLSGSVGLQTTMMILGVIFLVVVFALAQFLKAPPAGYVPPDQASTKLAMSGQKAHVQVEAGPAQMMRNWQVYLIWFMYACGAGAGLMVVSKMAKIATDQAGLSLGFLLVMTLAIGNGGGRIVAGMISDRLGRTRTMLLFFVLQAIMIALLSMTTKGSFLANPAILIVCSMIVGACYGSNLSVFPAITKDWYGLKNFGVNYGFVFTAWGVGGFALSLIAGAAYDASHSFGLAYYIAIVLLLIAAGCTFIIRPPKVASAKTRG